MKQVEDKLVSIGLPVFNGGPRVRRAIDSLLNQSYKNFELIISDNASTDNTQEICQNYARQDERVKYFRHDHNLGMVPNFYHSVTGRATGSYFIWTSDDDWWHPNFIATLKAILDNHPECGIALGSLRLVYEDGEPFDEVRFEGLNNPIGMSHSKLFDGMLFKGRALRLFIYGLFRIEVIRKLMWRPVPLVVGPDKILMSEAALITYFYSVPETLIERTVHRQPETERWEGDDYNTALNSARAYRNALMAWCGRLLQSPNLSWQQKTFVLPWKIILLFWVYKKHLLRELWPSSFKLLRRSIKIFNGH